MRRAQEFARFLVRLAGGHQSLGVVLSGVPREVPFWQLPAAEDDVCALLASRFYLVRLDDRLDEWVEMYTLMEIEAPDRWLCCALDATETELDYYDVKFAGGHMRPGAARATLLKTLAK